MGEKGSGKSVIARYFAKALGYDTHIVHLFKDMTSRGSTDFSIQLIFTLLDKLWFAYFRFS